MPETLLTVIKAGLAVSVFLMKFGVGLTIAPGDLRFIRERPGLMLRSLVAVAVLALLIGALNFPQIKPLPILIPCAVISALIVMVYAKWQGSKAK